MESAQTITYSASSNYYSLQHSCSYRKLIIGFVYLEANKRSIIFSVLENTDFILSSLCSIKRTISDGLKGRLCSGAVWKMMESDKVSEELEADKSSSTEGAYYFVS